MAKCCTPVTATPAVVVAEAEFHVKPARGSIPGAKETPWDSDEVIRGLLEPGEVVLWSGGPSATRVLDEQDFWLIVVGLWFSLAYLGLAYFNSAANWNVDLRVLPPALSLAYIAIVRPIARRSQKRRTVFVLTPTRALVHIGPPSRELEITDLPSRYQVRRRTDGRGTVTFDAEPRSPRKRLQGLALALRIVLFLLGLGRRPWRKTDKVSFYEVGDIDVVVPILQGLPHLETARSELLLPPRDERRGWSQVVERRFTSSRRVICGLVGVLLVASMLPIIAVRLRDYLQHSPTFSGSSNVHLALRPATYVIFEHTARAGPYDCSPVSVCVTILPSDVSVASPSGAPLSFHVDRSMDGITDGSDHYAGALKFDVEASVTFFIRISSSATTTFVIAKEPSEEAFALGGWITGGGIGILLIITALVGSLIARGTKREYVRWPVDRAAGAGLDSENAWRQ